MVALKSRRLSALLVAFALVLSFFGALQLQIIPVEVNLVVDVRRGCGTRKRRGRRRAGRQQLQSTKEAQH